MQRVISLSQEKRTRHLRAIKRDAFIWKRNSSRRWNWLTMLMDQNRKTHVFLIPFITSTRSFFPSRAGHAKKIIYLSADAFGVLPPVSILTTSKLSTTSFAVILQIGSEQNAVSLNRFLLFSPALVRYSFTLHPNMYAKTLGLKCRSTEQKPFG